MINVSFYILLEILNIAYKTYSIQFNFKSDFNTILYSFSFVRKLHSQMHKHMRNTTHKKPA